MSRVLQLLGDDAAGGVPVLADLVAKGLTARGHSVETLLLRAEAGRVVQRILSGRYEAILTYQLAAGRAGSLLGSLAGVRLRATHLTELPAAMPGHWRWLDRRFGQFGLHTAIIATSAATAAGVADYPQSYQDRLHLIPPGVEPLPNAVTGGWGGRLAIPPLAPLLVSAGRLTVAKNHRLAIAALPELPGAHLVVAGEGPQRPVLREQAAQLGVAGRLHLVGQLDRAGLAGLLAEADVLLVPALRARFGLVAIEAGMAGLPVIAADLPLLREVLAPAVPAGTVAFHRVDDAAALAAAVTGLLANYPASAQRRAAALALRRADAVEPMIDDYCRLLGDFRD